MDGEGARRYGGRWNVPGVAAVYLAESRALAAMEILVHTPREFLNLDWRMIEVGVSDSWIEKPPRYRIPENWRSHPSSQDAKAFGSRWLRDGQNLGLLLPSVIIPEESSLMINPSHPRIGELEIGKAVAFRFDSRLTRD
jgi:RES domain-containing protein